MKSCHIPAMFGKELFCEGFTNIPNLLIRYCTRLSLSGIDLLVLIMVFYFQQDNKKRVIAKDFADLLPVPEKQVALSMESLKARGLLVFNGDEIDISGLFEKIADHWAEEKVLTWQEASNQSFIINEKTSNKSSVLLNLYNVFEQEFGRPLTPIECEQIIHWCRDIGHTDELVLEALRRSVLRGIFNLNYIDKILSQWNQNNLRNLQEVLKYEEKHFKLKPDRDKPPKREKTSNREEKYKDLYL